ncbi:MAG: hypothetical protein AAFV53_31845 [Myxococcota bacterium]
MNHLTRQQRQLIGILRILERPGTPGEARTASTRLLERIRDPAMAGWLASVLEGTPNSAGRPRSEHALKAVLSTQKGQIQALRERELQKDHEIARLRRELKQLKADAWAFGYDPRLPQPGLQAAAWWAWLHERGMRLFNAGAMSEMLGAPSRSSLQRLSRKLPFQETWQIRVAGRSRPQRWRAVAEGVPFLEVVHALDIFRVRLTGIQITRPNGQTLREGVDFLRAS